MYFTNASHMSIIIIIDTATMVKHIESKVDMEKGMQEY